MTLLASTFAVITALQGDQNIDLKPNSNTDKTVYFKKNVTEIKNIFPNFIVNPNNLTTITLKEEPVKTSKDLPTNYLIATNCLNGKVPTYSPYQPNNKTKGPECRDPNSRIGKIFNPSKNSSKNSKDSTFKTWIKGLAK